MSVICLGEMLIDRLADEMGLGVSEVKHWTDYPGGAPANVACGTVKLGTPAAFIGCVGADDIGGELTDLLARVGVEITGLQHHPTAPTRVVYVTRSLDGDRSFAGFGDLDSSQFADAYLDAQQIPIELFTNAKFLAIGTISFAYPIGKAATERAMDLARDYGLKLLIDVNWRPMFWSDLKAAKVEILSWLDRADLIKMSDEEAQWLFNTEDPQLIRDRLTRSMGIFVTAGAAGCHYSLGKFNGFIPAMTVDSIDTTGAGDCFVAAILHQLCQLNLGEINTPEKAAQIVTYASAAGALATLNPGAIASQPTNADVLAKLRIKN
jgi:fructokinase